MYLWSTISRNTYSRLIEPCLYNQMKEGKQKQKTLKITPFLPSVLLKTLLLKESKSSENQAKKE